MRKPLIDAIRTGVLLADGAMGTQLLDAGLEMGGSGDAWNRDHPDRVRAIHDAYVEAGARVLLTNTFQASAPALTRHGLREQTYAINLAGARLARDAMGAGGYVLGDVGPFGGFLEPLGNTSRSELRNVFAEQVTALVDGGVDGIIIETMTAMEELETAVTATRDVRSDLLIVASVTYDRVADGGFRTMTGVDVAETVRFIESLGVAVIGCNCGTGLHIGDYVQLVGRIRGMTTLPIMVQPNAGQPRLERGRIVYEETAETMAAAVPALVSAGASVVGGCCGTTPRHIKLFGAQIAAGVRPAGA